MHFLINGNLVQWAYTDNKTHRDTVVLIWDDHRNRRTARNEKLVQDIYRKSTRYPWRRLVLFTESLGSMDQRVYSSSWLLTLENERKKMPQLLAGKCSTTKKTSMLSYWALYTDNICSSIVLPLSQNRSRSRFPKSQPFLTLTNYI